MPKQTVITIHGVNPDRQWQQMVHSTLDPHFFHCRELEYHDYDTLNGPIKAVLSLNLLYFSALTLFLTLVSAVLFNKIIVICLFVITIVSVILSPIVAWGRRKKCAERIKMEINKLCGNDRPHIIAHSLGTYIIGSIIKKFPGRNFNRVIFVSSVLPCSYSWKSLITERPRCVTNVRNEYGVEDQVTKIVDKLKWLTRDLGASGVKGFDKDDEFILQSDSATGHCMCVTTPHHSVVYNVPIREFTHSTPFLGNDHCANIWLPVLWGIRPDEFSVFLNDLRDANNLYELEMLNEFYDNMENVCKIQFEFLGNKTINCYIKEWLYNASVNKGIKVTDSLLTTLAAGAQIRLPQIVDTAFACTRVQTHNQ